MGSTMERAVVQLVLFSLLLASGTTLPNKDDWQIYSFHINSTVISRYATTVITSRVVNRVNESREIEFQVRIPKNAFISKFTMLIDNKVYDGVVKAKEQAEQQYTEAVSRGQSAGLVSSVGRTLEEFKTSVTVAALQKVTFELTYEELLKRTLGKYELQIHARPMQPVRDFKANVYIHEDAGISFMEVKGGLSTKALGNAITKTVAKKQAWVSFYPTADQQKTCDSCGEHGMNGDLVIVYDVNRDSSLGHIQKSSGYFVHHFAPSGLPRIPKNVVFVIDQSGSMHGGKMKQTQSALLRIFSDLAEDDYFGLITFDGAIFHWKRELVQATEENVQSARRFAQGIAAKGATDINSALLEGAQMLNAHPREGSASILILLTDGDPTSGVTNQEEIHSNVNRAIANKFPLYCLGFGFDVRFEFLEKMSLQNNGAARRIYEDSDADLQLKGFYEEVATPLLTDVTMIYSGGSNLTQTNFSQYYNGSEIVVAGQITDNNVDTFVPQVVATSNKKPVIFGDKNRTTESTEGTSDRHIQRVWAYLTVKQLLERELQLSGPEKEKVKNRAMELSLKYSFVTPLTSMVVTKPTGEDVLHKPKEGDAHMGHQARHGQGHHPPLLHTRLVGSRPPQTRFKGFGHAAGQTRNAQPGLPGPRPVSGGLGLGGFLFDPADDFYDNSFMTKFVDAGIRPTLLQPTDIPVSSVQRFLLKPQDQSLPLCFDVNGGLLLNLLKHPSGEFSVNGALYPLTGRGFNRIVVHFGPEHFVDVDAGGVSVTEGQKRSRHTGEELITAGSVTVIIREEEVDIAIGDTRLAILRHVKDGHRFFWPVVRQKPSVKITEGILAVRPHAYNVVQQPSSTKLHMNNKEIDVTRSSASDYSISFSPSLECWLMSAESALQRKLEDFIVAEL